jgi:phosphoenolpyruvate---glycerone phosphotransferase subunit DhaL
MSQDALHEAELVVRTIAQTAVDNEAQFGELDAVVGDGDLGFSLARGFGKLLDEWDGLVYDDVSMLLRRCATVISGRVGGTSGPIWGTAFLRASITFADVPAPSGADTVAALRAAAKGIQERGGCELGDKTLLDALVPAIDELERGVEAGGGLRAALPASADAALTAAEATKGMLARRGRAAYAGERSRDSVDAGAIVVAVMLRAVSDAYAIEATFQGETQ